MPIIVLTLSVNGTYSMRMHQEESYHMHQEESYRLESQYAWVNPVCLQLNYGAEASLAYLA